MISKEPEQLLSGILNKQTVPKGCFGVICIIEKKKSKGNSSAIQCKNFTTIA